MKRLRAFMAALVLSVSSLAFLAVPHAFAATKTWDGGGSDNNMTTGANWNADSAPSAGDDLVFPADMASDARAVVNDFTAGTSFNSITFSGAASADSGYSISGNSMVVVAGITNSMTGSFNTAQTVSAALVLGGNQTFATGTSGLTIAGTLNLATYTLTFDVAGYGGLAGVVSGSGGITKAGTGDLTVDGANVYTGATLVNAGTLAVSSLTGLGTSAGATTVASGATLYLYKGSGDASYAEPLTLNGTGVNDFLPTLVVANSYNAGGSDPAPYPTSTFTGAITLGSNVQIGASARNAKLTGAITGNFTVTLNSHSSANVEIASSSNSSATPNSTLQPAVKETTYAADSPSTSISVNTNETAIVTGTYGAVSVGSGGTLKGTGTVGDLTSFGKVAPGMSPGCLSTGNLSFQSSNTYLVELGGTTACTQYDQLKVTGSVALDGAISVSLYNNFKPKAGQKYIIISNDAADPVTGTFASLAQGATFTANGYTYSVSYTGGDGNDVELTVTAVAPNTGFATIKSNAILAMIVMTIAAGAILTVARRSKSTARRR